MSCELHTTFNGLGYSQNSSGNYSTFAPPCTCDESTTTTTTTTLPTRSNGGGLQSDMYEYTPTEDDMKTYNLLTAIGEMSHQENSGLSNASPFYVDSIYNDLPEPSIKRQGSEMYAGVTYHMDGSVTDIHGVRHPSNRPQYIKELKQDIHLNLTQLRNQLLMETVYADNNKDLTTEEKNQKWDDMERKINEIDELVSSLVV